MDESELRGLLDTKINNALGYWGGKLSTARTTALQYYNGEPFGNEEDGRSQVVSRDVAEAVDSMMPSLMKIFTSGDEVVRFDPTRPEDEEIAAQATDYVNWIWHQQNDGYKVFYDWFKDALLNRTAVVKIWWEETTKTKTEEYEGLTKEEYDLLLEHPESPNDEIEIVEEREYPDSWTPLAARPSAGAAGGGSRCPSTGGAAPVTTQPGSHASDARSAALWAFRRRWLLKSRRCCMTARSAARRRTVGFAWSRCPGKSS
jgi:hypothetical protein